MAERDGCESSQIVTPDTYETDIDSIRFHMLFFDEFFNDN